MHENRHALKFDLLLEGTLNRPSSCDTVKDVLSHLSLVTLSTSFLSWTPLFNEYGVERSNRLCLVAWLLAVRSVTIYGGGVEQCDQFGAATHQEEQGQTSSAPLWTCDSRSLEPLRQILWANNHRGRHTRGSDPSRLMGECKRPSNATTAVAERHWFVCRYWQTPACLASSYVDRSNCISFVQRRHGSGSSPNKGVSDGWCGSLRKGKS